MLALLVDFEIKREHAAAFLRAIQTQAANSLARESACRHFDVCVDPENECRIFLYEVYDDQAAVEAHRKTPHFANYMATVEPMIADKKLRIVTVLKGLAAPR